MLQTSGLESWNRVMTSALHFLTTVKLLIQFHTGVYCNRSSDGLHIIFAHAHVCVNGSSSDILPVSSGVPQGSVLGPLLFIIFIDDITDLQLSDGSTTLCADDIMLYRPNYTPADYSLLQQDIDDICTWTTNNLLNFNSNKCKYMIISRKR